MKKRHIANLIAVGVGVTSMTTTAEAAIHNVFDLQPRAINIQISDLNQFSLSNILQMINQRNCLDLEIVRSSVDAVLHM